jgi:hypothetical protein
MKESKAQIQPTAIYRKDYKPTPYLIDQVHLDFNLGEDATRVVSKLHFKPNYQGSTPPVIFLDGALLAARRVQLYSFHPGAPPSHPVDVFSQPHCRTGKGGEREGRNGWGCAGTAMFSCLAAFAIWKRNGLPWPVILMFARHQCACTVLPPEIAKG